jgi:hypothetical protein
LLAGLTLEEVTEHDVQHTTGTAHLLLTALSAYTVNSANSASSSTVTANVLLHSCVTSILEAPRGLNKLPPAQQAPDAQEQQAADRQQQEVVLGVFRPLYAQQHPESAAAAAAAPATPVKRKMLDVAADEDELGGNPSPLKRGATLHLSSGMCLRKMMTQMMQASAMPHSMAATE